MNSFGTRNMPAVRPYWITHPWSLIFLGNCAIREVEHLAFADAMRTTSFNLDAVLENNPHLLLELLRKHFDKAFPRLEAEIMQLRVEDAFGRWWKRIGKHRRAAFEAMILADDPEAMRAAYEYANVEYRNLRDRRIVRKLERKTVRLQALTAELVAKARGKR